MPRGGTVLGPMTAAPASAPAPTPTGLRLWIAGARPRTLGAAFAPVLVGTAVAGSADAVVWWRAGAALVVALALQVGVNYANDYSDGVRGTDFERRGPLRLTASGLARPGQVRMAAVCAFGVAAIVGLIVSIAVAWWLVGVGAACIVAATLYTGGPRPYGYSGLGELMVLVFFGFVATVGSSFVHTEQITALATGGAVVVGLLACAILLVNNVRDIESDRVVGKRTLAVRIGSRAARGLYAATVVGSFIAVAAIGLSRPWALIALGAAPLAVVPLCTVLSGVSATDPGGVARLVGALVATSRLEVVVGVLLAAGLWI